MNTELYDAPKEAGASDASARKAAFESRLARVVIDLAVIKWMIGFNLATTVAVLFTLLRH